MAHRLPELVPSIKLATFRMNDEDSDEADAEYIASRRLALRRARYMCEFCGFATVPDRKRPEGSLAMSGYLEGHHLDDDHQNNSKDNIAIACPFCHQVFHAGFAGTRKAIRLIWLPHISQANLNLLMNISLSSIHMGNRYKDRLTDLYKSLSGETKPLIDNFGEAFLDPTNFGQILIGLHKRGHYDKRTQLFSGLRFLPEASVFERYLDWWGNRVWPEDSTWEGIAYKEQGIDVT